MRPNQSSIIAFVGLVFLGGLVLGASPPLLERAMAPMSDPVLAGAGDITNCSRTQDEATAQLLDGIAGTVITMGDNAYPDGTLDQFNNCYDPTWGRHKDRTHPSPGNHDYHVAGAAGYYTYFGAAASPLDTNCTSNCKGYYSYNLGEWHIIALNSEIDHSTGSAQEQWLRADLAANSTLCTLAYWHKPRFSSGKHGNNASFQPFWQALYDYGADVVLNAHDHSYERFAPQNPTGQAEPTRGIREFVVGTGGASLYSFLSIQPNSEVRNNTTWGVLKLTLHPASYDWEFVPIAGQTFTDSGSANCVTLGPTPTPAATPPPTSTPLSAGDVIYVSSTSGGSVGGVSFSDEDILVYDTTTGMWSMSFDGSDVGLGGTDVDAFSLLSDGSILISIDSSTYTISGFGTIEDRDIVKFIPTSLGLNTAGSFAWYFDGSDVGLTSSGEDIDAIDFAPDGRLLVSTRGSFSVPGASGLDEDLAAFSPTSLGQNTAGTWAFYFDGSDVGLNTDSSEDVNAVWVDGPTGEIYLSTLGSFHASGLSGLGADLFICTPSSLGATTNCAFRMYWVASNFGWGGEVTDGFSKEE